MKFKNAFIHFITVALFMLSLMFPVSASGVEDMEQYQIKYRAHVSNIGWQGYVDSPNEAGTTGQALGMEALELQNGSDSGVGFSVQPYVEGIGWMDPVESGVAGTTGQARHLEALKISLVGENKDAYNVYYRVHVSNIGWMEWVVDGAQGGTTDTGMPIEAIQISVVPRGQEDLDDGPGVAVDLNDSTGFSQLSVMAPDIMQEVRYYSTYNFVGDRIDGYETPTVLMTKEAAQALKEANDELMAKGMRLKVYDAYRPQMAVDHFVRWAKDVPDQRMKAYFYPNVDKGVLFEQDYIAEKSGHTRGSTVDLTIFDMNTGKDLDMGGTFDLFDERSHPDFVGDLTEEQLANRNLLRDLMIRHGFRPLASEWWHFTLNNEPYPDTYFTFPVTDLPTTAQ